MSDDVFPTQLEKSADHRLVIRWSDGLKQTIPFRTLRDECPCANCIERRLADLQAKPSGELPVISAAQTMPLDITRMSPIGNYAYNIGFSDGHSTGIFTFDLLRSFGA
jgi:DUF971 family protein